MFDVLYKVFEGKCGCFFDEKNCVEIGGLCEICKKFG